MVNLAPERFRFVHAQVPFVDALTTVLDPSLPLTVVEWEEWGNPLEDPTAYALMKSYAPYENVRPTRHPSLLVTAGLDDTRVYVTEPAKWVAALRHADLEVDEPAQILFRTEMAAGHGGPVRSLRPVAPMGLGETACSSTRRRERPSRQAPHPDQDP